MEPRRTLSQTHRIDMPSFPRRRIGHAVSLGNRRGVIPCDLRQTVVVGLFCLLGLLLSGIAQAAPTLPQFSASASPDHVRAGEPLSLELTVQWQGDHDAWTLYPPTLKLSSNVTQGGLQQFFETSGGVTRYHYQYSLIANTAGSLPLGEADLQVRASPGVANAPSDSQTLNIDLPTVEVLPGGSAGALGQALPVAALLLLSGGGWFLYRRRLSPTPVKSTPAPSPTPEVLLTDARKAMMDGRDADAYALLRRIKPLLPSAEDPLPGAEHLEAAELKARYGGGASNRQELERMLDSVARTLKLKQRQQAPDA